MHFATQHYDDHLLTLRVCLQVLLWILLFACCIDLSLHLIQVVVLLDRCLICIYNHDLDIHEVNLIPSLNLLIFQDSYNFSYQVDDSFTGNQFGHSENRLGSATAGAYHVLLPDGRVQTVKYTVDSYAGYKATVNYQGGYQVLDINPVKYGDSKTVQVPLKQVYSSVNSVHHYGKSEQKAEERISVPYILAPAHINPNSAKYSKDHLIYQAASSHQHPVFVPVTSNHIDDHPSYRPVMYKPKSYKPAPVQTLSLIHI